MVERLRSIIKRTPWSLLLKSGILATAWGILSFPAFAVLAVLFYVLPFFRVRTFLFEFILILILAAIFPQGGAPAAIFWGLFILLFGMKDLTIVDREKGYEAFAMLLALIGSLAFYASATGSNWRGILPFLFAGIFAIAAALIFRRMPFEEGAKAVHILPSCIGGFLVWQLAFVLLFLPFNFLEASAVLFTFIAGFITMLAGSEHSEKGQVSILASFALFAAVAFAALLLAPWRV